MSDTAAPASSGICVHTPLCIRLSCGIRLYSLYSSFFLLRFHGCKATVSFVAVSTLFVACVHSPLCIGRAVVSA